MTTQTTTQATPEATDSGGKITDASLAVGAPPLADRENTAEVLAGLAFAAAVPAAIDEDGRFVSLITPAGGTARLYDLDAIRAATEPTRPWQEGAYQAHTLAALIGYVNRHATPATEVFADLDRKAVVAVIDSQEPADSERALAGRSRHTITLALRETEAWRAWRAGQGLHDQETFAEHLEDRLPEIIEPDAATFLEIASTLSASTSMEFMSGFRLKDGRTQFASPRPCASRAGSGTASATAN